MASRASGSLDYWRKFFRSANSHIFEVIENAIFVAASDCPKDFLIRRDGIAEKLFTCRLSYCLGCDRVRVPGGGDDDNDNDDDEGKGDDGAIELKREREGEKESKVDSSNNEEEPEDDLNRVVSNYSYDEAEALTEEIEEENQIVGEVLRLKGILVNNQEESDAVIFESLRRLQLMALSVETLKATEIGRVVNCLRKHNSKQIRYLVRTLIDGWKLLVDEWVNTVPAIPDNSPDSVNPSVLDEEEGLPSPPLDEGALFATQTTGIQLSEFFDGMDDDGNLRSEGVFNKKQENERKPPEIHKPIKKQQPPRQPVKSEEREQVRRQEQTLRQTKLPQAPNCQSKRQDIIKHQNKLSNSDSGPGRPRLASEQKQGSQISKTSNTPQDKSTHSDEAAVRAKLEVAKRKLHEQYQIAENAKKQRTIQVMELHDIPKHAHHNHRQFNNGRPKNHNRNWTNRRC